jgi:hypothetical protein
VVPDVLPVSVLEVAVVGVVEVVVVVVVVVGVVVLVDELEDDVDCVVLLVEELVGIEGVEEMCRWQSLAASRATVPAPWLRSTRSVGLRVAGSVWTARFSARLALMAAPQLPDSTAWAIWSAWPLSPID